MESLQMEKINDNIFEIRGFKVMLDSDLESSFKKYEAISS